MHTCQRLMRPWSVLAFLALLGCAAPAVAAEPSKWQPMLAKSFQGEAKDVCVTSLVVLREPGCVFLQVEGKGVYCSSPGAGKFKPVTETWDEVCAHAQKKSNPKHRFVLSDNGIKESTDGGATWSEPIPLPKDFLISPQTWVQYDATNDVLYLTKKGSDLYKLARRK
jgi:hypothetical protein